MERRLPIFCMTLVLIGLFAGAAMGMDSRPVVPAESADARRISELRRRIEADNRQQPLQSVAFAQEALKRLEGAGKPDQEIWFQLSLIRDLWTLGDKVQARACVERAQPLIAQHGSVRDALELSFYKAIILLWVDQHYAGAVQELERVIPRAEARLDKPEADPGFKRMLAQCYRLSGVAHQKLNRLQESIELFRKSLKLFDAISDDGGRTLVYEDISDVYLQQGRLGDAEKSILSGLEIAERLKSDSILSQEHLHLGLLYGKMNDPRREMEEMLKARSCAEKLADPMRLMEVTGNIADACLRKKDYQSAKAYANATIKLASAHGERMLEAIGRVNLGIAMNRLGEGDEGIKHIQEGLDYYKSIHRRSEISELLGIQAEEYAFRGDFRNAYLTHREFKALSDQIIREADQQKVVEASAAFEDDKKRMQIAGLQKEQRDQARVRNLWVALGFFGFSLAIVLVMGRRKLQKANAALEERNLQLLVLNEQKNQFLGIAAHDLRTPLSSIVLLAEFILDEVEPGNAKKDLRQIIDQGQSMTDLIGRFLDINALESGKLKPVSELMDLADLVVRHSAGFRPKADKKDINLLVEHPPEGLLVSADPKFMSQILDNLISNAVKFSPRGSRIWVRVEDADTCGRISVIDEGPGLTTEDRGKLFKPYTRLSASPTAGEPSVGLGLSIVKQMVDAMGGVIRVESDHGKGAAFILELKKAHALP